MLLEAGSQSADLGASDLIGGLSVGGDVDLRFGFARQVGGSSNLWAGRTAPLQPIDFEARDWVPESGWPLASQALDDYYDAVARLLSLPDPVDDVGGGLAGLSARLSNGPLEAKVFAWSKPPFQVADLLQDAMAAHPGRLTLVINATVRALSDSPDGRAVRFAEVLAPSGKVVRVDAKVFVLAAGGLETPRILLDSTARNPAGIGNQYDVVGRYFSTHPKADIAALVLENRVPVATPLFSDTTISNGRLRYGIGLTATAQREHRCLNHYVQLSPLLEYRANRLFEIVKRDQALMPKLIDRGAVVRGVLSGAGMMAFEAISRIAGLQRRAKVFVLRGFLDQYPDRDNRIGLSAEREASGRRKITLRWRYGERDRASVLAFLGLLDGELRRLGAGRVEYDPLRESADWPLIGVHSHFMGTTRMGTDPHTSVVDADGKVHGVENLFVSGPSTFPTYGYANPFLTIAALALRLTDHLAQRVSSLATGADAVPARQLSN